ncbi:MAG: hypothetical protein K2M16_07695, partial [Muribaculaceae bacterium]|nr:hypothetical protein [Muribaculaceae bacterium]
MVKQILLVAGLAVGFSAVADRGMVPTGKIQASERATGIKVSDIPLKEAKINDGTRKASPMKAPALRPQWKRPAGQFWGTGYSLEAQMLGYYFTPLVLRPWVDYEFKNISTVKAGKPTWTIQYADFDLEVPAYVEKTSNDTDITQSYTWYESPYAPVLSYPGYMGYPTQYEGKEITDMQNLPLVVGESIADGWSMGGQPVSSHYWSYFTRNASDGLGLVAYSGATPYEGSERGWWFGTNASGVNAAATRFEKPDSPYLLNAVHWYYMFSGDIIDEIPLKAYVFKTANDAKEVSFESQTTGEMVTVENLEVGELIAVSEASIPVRKFSEDDSEGTVEFKFVEKNPATGAESTVSLEIEDDITIIVVGFNAPTSNGTFITSCMSTDDFDEGYGNLGFLGTFNVTEEGVIEYDLRAVKDFFSDSMPNTVLGVLADVSYPWLTPNAVDQPNEVHLPNADSGANEQSDLEYPLVLLSTSMTDDWDVTFNGGDECEWLEIVDVYDQMTT